MAKLPKRAVAVKRLDKLPPLPAAYLSFLQQCESVEITPDIRLWGYQTALNENCRLSCDYPDTAARYWLIGNSGQGDTWLIGKEGGNILFYDHNQGEYDEAEAQFADMAVGFIPFLQTAFLLQELETLLETQSAPNQQAQDAFQARMDEIALGLYERYPFAYW
ncbi:MULTISPECIES: SMI1/KNR4 family protein [Eikenella]|nr:MULTISPECIES: SMI1/KNR4 family protein [Eikenella]